VLLYHNAGGEYRRHTIVSLRKQFKKTDYLMLQVENEMIILFFIAIFIERKYKLFSSPIQFVLEFFLFHKYS
jgi:hypothetical protein